MITRFLFVFLIVVLALPTTVAMPPVHASTDVQEQVTPSLLAKKKTKKPKFKTVTRTVRQPLTQTFANPATITIPATDPTAPYPSTIAVAGFANGRILDVNLILNRISFSDPEDLEVLLATAHQPGLNAVVMRAVANSDAVSDVTLILDDQAAQPLPSPGAPLLSGTFRPTNAGSQFPFPAPAPALSGSSALAVFTNADPNGIWQLFVNDGVDSGALAGGWALQITAEVDVQVQERIKIKNKKKTKKKR